MAIKVIVELPAKPGKRNALEKLIDEIAAKHGPSAPGFLGSTRYEVLDDPDLLAEIADWVSAEVRGTHMEEAIASGIHAPALEMLAGPFKATVVRELP
jgi:quinol monooxygenase YgiN